MFILCAMDIGCKVDKNARAEELLTRIARGDADAVGELYELVKTDVYAFALSKTLHRADAEDIMQETFVRVFRYAKLYKPCGKPMAWIITIEFNLIRRFFTLASRSTTLDEAIYSPSAIGQSETETLDSMFVEQLLATLTEEEREIIVLHVVSGLKHREIAKILDKPLSTVLSKYNRALKKLRANNVGG